MSPKLYHSVPELMEIEDMNSAYNIYVRAWLYTSIWEGSPAWITYDVEVICIYRDKKEMPINSLPESIRSKVFSKYNLFDEWKL